jgi:single-strand DNA-binding protein
MSFNKVIMAGRLTKEPERRVSGEGKTFVNFTLAVNRNYKSNEADFFDCVAFGNTADYILNYVRKGYLVLVEGSLQINKWTDRNNVNHSKPEIIANVVKNFETKKKENAEEYAEKEEKSTKTEEENEFEEEQLFEGLELDDLDDGSPLR